MFCGNHKFSAWEAWEATQESTAEGRAGAPAHCVSPPTSEEANFRSAPATSFFQLLLREAGNLELPVKFPSISNAAGVKLSGSYLGPHSHSPLEPPTHSWPQKLNSLHSDPHFLLPLRQGQRDLLSHLSRSPAPWSHFLLPSGGLCL